MKKSEPVLESMTPLVIDQWKVRVWRQEPLESLPFCALLDQPDLRAAVDTIPFDWSGEESLPTYIAKRLLEVDRVNAVEVVDITGKGLVYYKEWP